MSERRLRGLGDDVGVLAASCTIGYGIVLRVVYNLTAVLFLPIKAVYLLGMACMPRHNKHVADE